jgi:hypothetical protein
MAKALAEGNKDLYNKIYNLRIVSLEIQITNFKKQLEECEKQNGH